MVNSGLFFFGISSNPTGGPAQLGLGFRGNTKTWTQRKHYRRSIDFRLQTHTFLQERSLQSVEKWYDDDVVGIDIGITMLMAENVPPHL